MAGGCHFRYFGWFRILSEAFFFFRFLEPRKKQGNFAENVGKSQKKSGKVEKNRYNQNFGGDILSISTDNRNLADISAEISEILFPACTLTDFCGK